MFDDTKLSRAGTDSDGNAGILNPPVYRASTIHFPTIEAFDTRFERRFKTATKKERILQIARLQMKQQVRMKLAVGREQFVEDAGDDCFRLRTVAEGRVVPLQRLQTLREFRLQR